jgi:putative Holliday junction resolvase
VTRAARDNALVFDCGTRRIGVATAHRIASTAAALTTLPARDGLPDWNALDTLVREWQPQVLVVGLPRNADGTDSEMTARAKDFAARLAERYRLPAEMVDERFTSAEAEELLRERRRSGVMTRRVREGDVDSLAAQLIAETWVRN